MRKPVYEEIAPEVEEMFWDHTVSEICDELDVSPNTYYRAKEHAGLPEKNQMNQLEYQYGVPADWLFDTLHNTLGKSVATMADELDVAHQWICDTMDGLGVPRRGHSESQKVRWAQLSEEEQQARMEAPLKARRLQPAYFETDHRGYERWQTTIGGERLSVPVHRLLAVAEYGFDAVVDNHVHHGPVEIPWANWHDNVRPMDPEEHLSLHKSEESTND